MAFMTRFVSLVSLKSPVLGWRSASILFVIPSKIGCDFSSAPDGIWSFTLGRNSINILHTSVRTRGPDVSSLIKSCRIS